MMVTVARWPGLSLGYTGRHELGATLNSRFFAVYFAQYQACDSAILFPQRLPRVGFFEELCANEMAFFREAFQAKLLELKQRCQVKESGANAVLNALNALLRCGQFSYVAQYQPPVGFDVIRQCECEYLSIIAEIECAVSASTSFQLGRLLSLLEKTKRIAGMEPRLPLLILLRYIVYSYRYQAAMDNFDGAALARYVTEAHALACSLDVESLPLTKLLKAYAYRGLAMSPVFTLEQKDSMLEEAECLSRALIEQSATVLEEIVYQENFYTLCQTMAKHCLYSHKAPEKAQAYFLEMIALDPNDSTAYSELALLLYYQGDEQQAIKYFKKASELGPPGVGMNLFYLGDCLQRQGREGDAVRAFTTAIEVDPYALSPQLELVAILKARGLDQACVDRVNAILNSNILSEQLTDQEKEELTHYVSESCV